MGGLGNDTLDGGPGDNRLIYLSGSIKEKGKYTEHYKNHHNAFNPSSFWVKSFVGDLAGNGMAHDPNGNIKIIPRAKVRDEGKSSFSHKPSR